MTEFEDINIDNDNNKLLQLPIEELIKLIGVTDKEIVYLEDDELNVLCDDLSNGKNIRLRLRLRLHKDKLISELNKRQQENPPSLIPHEKYLINLPVDDLVLFKKMGDFWKQSDRVQEMINKKIKEEERLLREYEEREELERQKELQQKIEKEEADKIEKEEVDNREKEEVDNREKARLKKLAICPYCNKQVISKKQLKDEVSVTCPQCGGEVETCGLCDKIVKHPHLADDCEWKKAFKR